MLTPPKISTPRVRHLRAARRAALSRIETFHIPDEFVRELVWAELDARAEDLREVTAAYVAGKLDL